MESPKEKPTAQTADARVEEWARKYLRGLTTISSPATRSTLSIMPFWTQVLHVLQGPLSMSPQSPVSSASISLNTRKSEGLSSSVEIKKFEPADPDRPTYQVQVWKKPDVLILSFNDNGEARWVNYGSPTIDLDKALEWATEASETYRQVQVIKSSVRKEVIHVGR